MSNDQYLLTPGGLEKLKEELHQLKTVRRKEVAGRIETAKALGDLSENAEYQEAKEESAWVEGRILELSDMFARGIVIEGTDLDIVSIGRTVTVKSKDSERVFTIVGANEADPLHGRISSGSPMATALLGKHVDDEVEVKTPGGLQQFKVVRIE
ncbi:MAG: transcription elongation factor GreA [Patescibacteria group bacterium]